MDVPPPPATTLKEAIKRLAKAFINPQTGGEIVRFTEGDVDVEAVRRSIGSQYQSLQAAGLIIAGTPKAVIPKIRSLLEVLRPGIFGAWYHHGPMSYHDRRTGLRLFGKEVLPAMREMAKELDLPGPYEQTPGIRPLPASG